MTKRIRRFAALLRPRYASPSIWTSHTHYLILDLEQKSACMNTVAHAYTHPTFVEAACSCTLVVHILTLIPVSNTRWLQHAQYSSIVEGVAVCSSQRHPSNSSGTRTSEILFVDVRDHTATCGVDAVPAALDGYHYSRRSPGCTSRGLRGHQDQKGAVAAAWAKTVKTTVLCHRQQARHAWASRTSAPGGPTQVWSSSQLFNVEQSRSARHSVHQATGCSRHRLGDTGCERRDQFDAAQQKVGGACGPWKRIQGNFWESDFFFRKKALSWQWLVLDISSKVSARHVWLLRISGHFCGGDFLGISMKERLSFESF